MRPSTVLLFLFVLGLLASCHSSRPITHFPAGAEAISLDGKPLYPTPLPPATQLRYDSLLSSAKAKVEAAPGELDNWIWYGRRTAYLGRYREAIGIFTQALERFPNSPELFRHRGHRFITIRELDLAEADFQRAARLAKGRRLEIEPDGLPNRLNQPLSNLQFNIYYHWGLAYYLQGDFARAARRYEECMRYSDNDDLITATADWLYMCYRRLGETEKAARLLERIHPEMNIIENDAYFQRLLMYKGLKKPEELLQLDAAAARPDELLNLVTQGYGVGNWYGFQGDAARARDIFQRIIDTGYWSAFGYIAAEAELAKSGKTP